MTPTLDLYQLHGLDRTQASDELAILLAGRDAALENRGELPDSPQRRQVQVAYSVLKSETTRAAYDEALAAGRPLSWHELEHLGNFGTFPAPTVQPGFADYGYPTQPPPNPFAPPTGTAQRTSHDQAVPGYSTPFHTAATPPSPAYPNYEAGPGQVGTYGTADAQDRPSAGLRLGMMLLDSLAAGVLGTVVGGLFFFSGNLAALALPLIGIAYVLGFEVYTGATPVKHLFGYEVRDAATGKRLSLEQSAKRNWWRLVGLIPFIGSIVAFVGMIVIGSSINPSTGHVGVHDRWAGAEVVRKQRR